MKTYALPALYILVVLLPALAFFAIPGESHSVLWEMGRAAAVTGFALVMMQVILAARIKAINEPYGFDMMIRFHQLMGGLGLVLLVVHPLLLAAGGGGWQLLLSLDLPWTIWVGKGALLLVLINVLVAALRKRLRLGFERWRLLHDVVGPLLLVAVFVHSWFIGDDLEHAFYQALWLLFVAAAVTVFVYHRWLRTLRLKPAWGVTRVQEVARGVWTIGMKPPANQPQYQHLPGQFHFLTFKRGADLPVEEHHFTISSSPTEAGEVTSTIKESGDFTETIGKTEVGDQVVVQGPFGRFSVALHPEEKKLLFIVGGIGITPVRAMLHYLSDEGEERDVVLLYGNRTEADIVFREELDELVQREGPLQLKVVHVLSEAGSDWVGETGLIEGELITKQCADLSERVVYLCGPPAMARKVKGALEERGVTPDRLREEKFTF